MIRLLKAFGLYYAFMAGLITGLCGGIVLQTAIIYALIHGLKLPVL